MRDLDPRDVPDRRLADPAVTTADPPALEVSDGVAGFHRALLERLGATDGWSPSSMDPRSAAPRYDVLVSALSEHVAVMERVVNPVLRRSTSSSEGTGELARLAAELVRAMHGIEQHLYGDARAPREDVPALHARLVELLSEHARLEEGLLREAEAAMSVAERQRLVGELEAASRHAPTRPHPHAPHAPWLVPLSFRVTALWDDALDAMDVRQVSGRARREPKPVGLWGSYLFGSGMTDDAPAGPAVRNPTDRVG